VSSTNIEAKRQAEIVRQKTGEFFCQTGKHYRKGEFFLRNGRKQCADCKTRIQAIAAKK